MLLYKVSKKYLRGPEQMIAKFNEHADANLFINLKLEQDASLRVNATYLIYEGNDLVETIEGGGSSSTSLGTGTGTQKASTQAFSPSPFQVAPRPGGVPPSSFKDIDEDKKK